MSFNRKLLRETTPISREVLEASEYVCWSRMQAESGETLDAIVQRKESERRAGNGLFVWGVGNPPAIGTSSLARMQTRIPVVFSIMKARPKLVDTAPSRIVAWRRYFDFDGAERDLPPGAVVTSRAESARGIKRVHYALMCFSPTPLAVVRGIPFDVSPYRNVGGTGAPVGASQVTALLKRSAAPQGRSDYEINISGWLAGGYWVRLSDPVNVPSDLSARISEQNAISRSDWLHLAHEVRDQPSSMVSRNADLFA